MTTTADQFATLHAAREEHREAAFSEYTAALGRVLAPRPGDAERLERLGEELNLTRAEILSDLQAAKTIAEAEKRAADERPTPEQKAAEQAEQDARADELARLTARIAEIRNEAAADIARAATRDYFIARVGELQDRYARTNPRVLGRRQPTESDEGRPVSAHAPESLRGDGDGADARSRQLVGV